MSRPGKRRTLPCSRRKERWYSEKDYQRIARAIGEEFLVARVKHRSALFECAASWYFRARDEPDHGIPSITRKELKQIASAARKLLKHLGIDDANDASDGPSDWVHLDALASAAIQGTEDDVAQATARVGRLIEIIHSIEAAQELHKSASQAAMDQSDLARIRGEKGHRGNTAEINWIACLMEIYKVLTGKEPHPGRGGAGNPLTRFLKAAAAPLGIRLARDWRSRIRIALEKSRAHEPDRDQFFSGAPRRN